MTTEKKKQVHDDTTSSIFQTSRDKLTQSMSDDDLTRQMSDSMLSSLGFSSGNTMTFEAGAIKKPSEAAGRGSSEQDVGVGGKSVVAFDEEAPPPQCQPEEDAKSSGFTLQEQGLDAEPMIMDGAKASLSGAATDKAKDLDKKKDPAATTAKGKAQGKKGKNNKAVGVNLFDSKDETNEAKQATRVAKLVQRAWRRHINLTSIHVGTFKYKGTVKHYAFVPPQLLSHQPSLQQLMKFWSLQAPEFLIGTNTSMTDPDKMITEENAADVIQDSIRGRERHVGRSTTSDQDMLDTTAARWSNCCGWVRKHLSPQKASGMIMNANKTPQDRFASELLALSINRSVDAARLKRPTEDKEEDESPGGENSDSGSRSNVTVPSKQQRAVVSRATTPIHHNITSQSSLQFNNHGASIAPNSDAPQGDASGRVSNLGPDWVNGYVEKTTGHVLSSIVSAAEVTDSWIVCHGHPSANDRMLGAAIDVTGSTPIVLVVDDLTNYNDSWEYAGNDLHIKLKKASTPISEATDEVDPLDLDKFGLYDQFDMDNKDKNDDSIPYRKRLWRDGDNPTKHRANWPWIRGSHFLFTTSHKKFKPSTFGIHGYICIHGASGRDADPVRTGGIIRDSVLNCRPCILFNNTGAETQMYARLIQSIRALDEASSNQWFYEEAEEIFNIKKREIKEIGDDLATTHRPEQPEEQTPTSGNRSILHRRTSRPPFQHTLATRNLVERNRKLSHERQTQEQRALRDMYKFVKDHRILQSPKMTGTKKLNGSGHYERLKNLLHFLFDDLVEYSKLGQLDSKTLEPGLDTLTRADVLQIADLYCSNPGLFSSVVVPVDPLKKNPEQILEVLSECFERASMERREVGAGQADADAIEQAWRIHHQLWRTKMSKWRLRGILYAIALLSSFFATFVVVYAASQEETSTSAAPTCAPTSAATSAPTSTPTSTQIDNIKLAAITLPAIVTLFSGILSLLALTGKISKIKVAMGRIESELFSFRMRVGKYSLTTIWDTELTEKSNNGKKERSSAAPGTVANKREGAKVKGEIVFSTYGGNVSSAMHKSREKFRHSLNEIVGKLAPLELDNDPFGHGALTAVERAGLGKYVTERLYWHGKYLKSRHMSAEAALKGKLSGTDYFWARVSPLLSHLQTKVVKLRRRMRCLQCLIMFMTTLATIFGAVGEIIWIPVFVAASTVFLQLLSVEDYPRRVENIAEAIGQLRSLETLWTSISIIDRNTPASRAQLVQTCEQIVQKLANNSPMEMEESPEEMKKAIEREKRMLKKKQNQEFIGTSRVDDD